jgi:hypothetical protein
MNGEREEAAELTTAMRKLGTIRLRRLHVSGVHIVPAIARQAHLRMGSARQVGYRKGLGMALRRRLRRKIG